jgi:hypothetical protein
MSTWIPTIIPKTYGRSLDLQTEISSVLNVQYTSEMIFNLLWHIQMAVLRRLALSVLPTELFRMISKIQRMYFLTTEHWNLHFVLHKMSLQHIITDTLWNILGPKSNNTIQKVNEGCVLDWWQIITKSCLCSYTMSLISKCLKNKRLYFLCETKCFSWEWDLLLTLH